MHLINNTPFQTLAVPTVCHRDKNHLVIVVKASFGIKGSSNALSLLDDQQEIFLADQHWSDPDESSLRYESDIALQKSCTDVALIASVYPENPPAKVVEAAISIADSRKSVRVFGNRSWIKSSTGYQVSSPEPFEKMPMVYENAYGGKSPSANSGEFSWDERNPLGKGFFDWESGHQPDNLPLPNLENPEQLITNIKQQPEPWCTGFVSRSWLPRKSYAGTYDDDWLKTRNPLLPLDFDKNVNTAASSGLAIRPYLKGGELVQLENLSPKGRLAFYLPLIELKIETSIKGDRCLHDAVMDTVVIEPDEERVSITWRTAVPIHWNLSMIEWIKVNYNHWARKQ